MIRKILENIGWGILGLFIVSLFVLFCWQNSVGNDFRGDIRIIASGEYQIQRDCFGDPVIKYLGDLQISTDAIFIRYYPLCKVPQTGDLNGDSYSWDKLNEGRNYVLYEKTFFLGNSYFIDCAEPK